MYFFEVINKEKEKEQMPQTLQYQSMWIKRLWRETAKLSPKVVISNTL